MELDDNVKRLALLVLGCPQSGSTAVVEVRFEATHQEHPGGCVRLSQFGIPSRDGHGPIDVRVPIETWRAAIRASL